jgi:hypothetical protein
MRHTLSYHRKAEFEVESLLVCPLRHIAGPQDVSHLRQASGKLGCYSSAFAVASALVLGASFWSPGILLWNLWFQIELDVH